MYRIGLVLGVFFAVACGKSKVTTSIDETVLAPPVVEEIAPAAGPATPPLQLQYRAESEKPSTARVFLVAGARDGAAFAQDIIEQKRLWEKSGVSPEDIHCYYAKPPEGVLKRDEASYRDIAQELSNCFPANSGLVQKHLMESSRSPSVNSLYFYVSSQGGQPPSLILEHARLLPQRPALEKLIREIPEMDQFLIRLDAFADGSTPSFMQFIRALYTNRSQGAQLLFSPRYLASALSVFSAAVTKVVVINGSYSGGFIHASDQRFDKDSLKNVPGVTVLTSANWDEANPSLASSDRQTLFGRGFNRILSEELAKRIPLYWRALASEVRVEYEDAQRARKQKHPAELQFYTSP